MGLSTSASATADLAVTNPDHFWTHVFGAVTSGGTWAVQVQWSADGVTWVNHGASVTLASTSTTITISGMYPYLQLVATKTGGTLSAWVVQSNGDHGAR